GRWTILALICALQAASLFFVTGTYDLRPWRQPDVFTAYDGVLGTVRNQAGYDRTYIFGDPSPPSSRNLKRPIAPTQMPNRVFSANEYEPLTAASYGVFFDYVAPRNRETPFVGMYALSPTARWRPMKLTGTRYFAAYRGGMGDALFAHGF